MSEAQSAGSGGGTSKASSISPKKSSQTFVPWNNQF